MLEEENKKEDQHHDPDIIVGCRFLTPPRRRSSGTSSHVVNAGHHPTQSPRNRSGEQAVEFSTPASYTTKPPPLISRRWKNPLRRADPVVKSDQGEDLEDNNDSLVILPSSSSLLLVTSGNEDSGANAGGALLEQEELAFRRLTRDLEARFLARQRSAFEEAQAPLLQGRQGQDLKSARSISNERNPRHFEFNNDNNYKGHQDSVFPPPDDNYYCNNNHHLTSLSQEAKDEFFLCLPSDIADDDKERQMLSLASNMNDEPFSSPLSSLGGSPLPDASCCRTKSSTTTTRNKYFFSSSSSSSVYQEELEDDELVIATKNDHNLPCRSHDLWRDFATQGHVEKHFPDSNRYFVPIRPRVRDIQSTSCSDDFMNISKLNQDFPCAAEETDWLERVAHCDHFMMNAAAGGGDENNSNMVEEEKQDHFVAAAREHHHEPGFCSLDNDCDDVEFKDEPLVPFRKAHEYSQESCYIQQRKKARTVSIGYDCTAGAKPLASEKNNKSHNPDTIMEGEDLMMHQHGMYHHISSPPRRKVSYAKSTKVFGSTAILAPTPIRLEGYSHAQYHNMVIKDPRPVTEEEQETSTNDDQFSPPMPTPTPLHYDCDHRKFGFSEYHRMVHSIHCESPFYK